MEEFYVKIHPTNEDNRAERKGKDHHAASERWRVHAKIHPTANMKVNRARERERHPQQSRDGRVHVKVLYNDSHFVQIFIYI